MRFQISGSASDAMYYVDDNGKTLSDMSGIWSIGENGTTSQLSESTGLYVITSSSTDPLHSSSVSGSGLFTVTGTGNGHNVGMSQWGAYAMAKQGFTYDQILKFYYTGIDLN
jgi:stage II sporulation protein D